MTRTVSGVATSITAFVGRTLRGPTDRPVIVKSFAEFTRLYGGLWLESPLATPSLTISSTAAATP